MRRASFAILLALLAGCAPHLSGQLVVDGRPFVGKRCRQGVDFQGVELTDQEGRKLRLSFVDRKMRWELERLPGAPYPAAAALKVPGQGAWEAIGACGPLTVEHPNRQTTQGEAQLTCSSPQHQIAGAVQFQGCP